nr:PAS domain-containing sensor histidine kinase [Beijerinckia indica]
MMLEQANLLWPVLITGLSLVVILTALASRKEEKRARAREKALLTEIHALQTRIDRAELFVGLDPQLFIAWSAPGEKPEIAGDPGFLTGKNLATGSSPSPDSLLAFKSWMSLDDARDLQARIDLLREKGESFHLSLGGNGQHLDIEGRPIGGRAVVRIRDVSAARRDLLQLREEQTQILADLAAVRTLLDAVPHPAWQRDGAGHLSWVNLAYVRAIEARDRQDAVVRGVELLEHPTRDASDATRATGHIWQARAAAVVAGARRMLDIIEMPVPVAANDMGQIHGRRAALHASNGSQGITNQGTLDQATIGQEAIDPGTIGKGAVGMASDVSELEAMRSVNVQQAEAHARTLDQLTTAVAIFDRTKRLVFHNTAYRQLWALDQAWLDQGPTDAEILDRLRMAHLLPEQVDFRSWKQDLFSAYQALETREQLWYLPDGRTLRSVITPNPQGGVTYLFDDTTERFHLESRFNAAIRVQSETLDTLQEGVAVFGSDGRLKLFNPAFAALWKLEPEALGGEPHIDKVASLCAPLLVEQTAWDNLRTVVAGLLDERLGLENRLTRQDGSVLDYAAAPLPDGATLITFIDMTASVNVERALTERNQALLDAEKLRNDFVHHVSYELRSPLTNIIGFIEMLGEGAVGPLNEKQHEYIGYVMASSSALRAIINDILDLASIDADAMDLSLEEVDIAEAMRAAAEGVRDRLRESTLTLAVDAAPDIGVFLADGKRIRQILFNLLSNAIGFSTPGQTVTLAASRSHDEVIFKVIDEGCGIPDDMVEHVFDRFKTHAGGSNHRGVGLGLSIVRSFVQLHGGRVLIETKLGKGTTMTCIFPSRGEASDPKADAQTEQSIGRLH